MYKVGDKVIKDGKVRYFDGFGWSDKPPGQAQTVTKLKDQLEKPNQTTEEIADS